MGINYQKIVETIIKPLIVSKLKISITKTDILKIRIALFSREDFITVFINKRLLSTIKTICSFKGEFEENSIELSINEE